MAKIAGIHGLKTADAQDAAKKLGIRAQRGAALLSPAQQELMHPELRAIKADKTIQAFNRPTWPQRKPGVYKVTDEQSGFVDGSVTDGGHLGFTNEQMREQLEPLRKKLEGQA
ncbi:hypothetical protein QN239_20350 [Mycolicibacterium sp. Y3]